MIGELYHKQTISGANKATHCCTITGKIKRQKFNRHARTTYRMVLKNMCAAFMQLVVVSEAASRLDIYHD
jgi:hypothetical protein